MLRNIVSDINPEQFSIKNYFLLTGLSALELHFLHLIFPAIIFRFEALILALHFLQTKMSWNNLAVASWNFTILLLHSFNLFHNFVVKDYPIEDIAAADYFAFHLIGNLKVKCFKGL